MLRLGRYHGVVAERLCLKRVAQAGFDGWLSRGSCRRIRSTASILSAEQAARFQEMGSGYEWGLCATRRGK